MESVINTKWYIIYTFPNLEKRIHAELIRKSIKAYLPLQKVIRKWSDRKKELKIPMFPNYIFINATEKDRGKILNISGILKFISFGGKPAVMSDDEILNIMKLEETLVE